MGAQPQCLGSIHLATGCGHVTGPHGGGAVPCHCGQAVDLRPVMPAVQLRVMDEVGTYLCVARALVFEGSILAYNPHRDEAEWVPTHGLANDLTWTEERSAVALANYVPHVSQEAARIARMGAH